MSVTKLGKLLNESVLCKSDLVSFKAEFSSEMTGKPLSNASTSRLLAMLCKDAKEALHIDVFPDILEIISLYCANPATFNSMLESSLGKKLNDVSDYLGAVFLLRNWLLGTPILHVY